VISQDPDYAGGMFDQEDELRIPVDVVMSDDQRKKLKMQKLNVAMYERFSFSFVVNRLYFF
jgi:hypothetical protein